MSTEGSVAGAGERLVQMVACAQRETDRVEAVLPSVDHLALRRRCIDSSQVGSELEERGPEALLEPFQSWRRLIDDFDHAVRRLARLRDARDAGPGYQEQLDEAIDEARVCRKAVEEANEHLQRRAAALIDTALAHDPVTDRRWG